MSTHAATQPPSPPTEASLREAALWHLARYAASEARLLRVLIRRIERWQRAAEAALPGDDGTARQAASAKAAARRVVAALAAQGAVNDAAYAESRARSLRRAGKSAVAVAQHLALRGVNRETARAALPEDAEAEFAAALLLARKRRAGPFGDGAEEEDGARRRLLGAFARAGFSADVTRRALACGLEEAEEAIAALRRG